MRLLSKALMPDASRGYGTVPLPLPTVMAPLFVTSTLSAKDWMPKI